MTLLHVKDFTVVSVIERTDSEDWAAYAPLKNASFTYRMLYSMITRYDPNHNAVPLDWFSLPFQPPLFFLA